KSPVILGRKYFLKVMQYIWLNRKEVDFAHDPGKDLFNSVSWRLKGKAPQIFVNPEEQELIDRLLVDYGSCEFDLPKNIPHFIRSLFHDGLRKMEEFTHSFFENYHTIGDSVLFDYRQQLMNAHRRQQAPPGLTQMLHKS